MRCMYEWSLDLVFTSAHFGARPERAAWQGGVFSCSGSSPDYPAARRVDRLRHGDGPLRRELPAPHGPVR